MNIDFLKRLYWACSNENCADAEDTRLDQLYIRLDEAGKADHCFSEELFATGLTSDEKGRLDELGGITAIAYEEQGFINGFRLGMKLAGELQGGGEPR